MKACGYLIGQSISLEKLNSHKRFREVEYFNLDRNEYFIFPYGVVVCWGDGELKKVLPLIETLIKGKPFKEALDKDRFDIQKTGESEIRIQEDIIYLDSDDVFEKLSLSHAIAQNLRLSFIEINAQNQMRRIKGIPRLMGVKGKIPYSKKELTRLLADIFSLKSQVSFEYSVLDKPEFFWERPEFDKTYRTMAIYLELEPRLNVLEKKIDVLNDFLSLLRDELNHRHSSKLEWIIILLILIEIIIFFVKDVFHLI